MATKSELRSRILRALNRTGAATNQQADLDSYLQAVIREDLCGDHAWSFMQKQYTLALVAGVKEYAVPAFQSDLFRDVNFIEITDSGETIWTTMEEVEYQTLHEAWNDDSNTQEPEVWCLYQGDKILVAPVPDAAYQARIHVWEYPDELADAESNFLTIRFPQLLLYGVCARYLAYHGDVTKASWYENIFQAEKARIIAKDRILRGPRNRVLKQSAAAGRTRVGGGSRRNRQNTGGYPSVTYP